MTKQSGKRRDNGASSFLPDFRSPVNLLYLLLSGAAFALVYTLAAAPINDKWLVQFGLVLFLTLWVGLFSALILYAVSFWLESRPSWQMAVSVPIILAFAAMIVSLVVLVAAPLELQPVSDADFLIRNALIGLLVGGLLSRVLVIQADWRERVVAESRARLDALQARIRPHFMFNALNAIAELVHVDASRAEEALLDISDLLRTALNESSRHSLSDELSLTNSYLQIEKLRLGDRLQVKWVMPDNLPKDLEIPALILQPLVENAVIHGIAARADGGKLTIRAQRMSFKRLRFEIENPTVAPGDKQRSKGHGMGMTNIKQRLALAYEERASLKTWTHDGTFHAALTVPLDA